VRGREEGLEDAGCTAGGGGGARDPRGGGTTGHHQRVGAGDGLEDAAHELVVHVHQLLLLPVGVPKLLLVLVLHARVPSGHV
jgi:hypothetical protein